MKKDPQTNKRSRQMTEHRRELIASGAKVLYVLLNANSAKQLADLCSKYDLTQVSLIELLLAKEYKKLL